MLLHVGHTSKIRGFVSKSGKSFSAALVLQDGRAVFDFQNRLTSEEKAGKQAGPAQTDPPAQNPLQAEKTEYAADG